MIHSFSWGRVSSLACRRHFPLQASSIPYITQPVAAFSTKHKQQYKGHTSRNVQPPHNKGKWHPYEDEMLREAVRAHRDEAGTIEWSAVKVRMEGTRSYQQSIDRWLKHLKLHEENDSYRKSDEPPVQNYWSESEDELLRQAISQHKYKTNKGKNKVNWNGVLAHFQGTRSYMQCYLRWNVVLKPRKLYKYGTWSTAEDDIILEAMAPGQPLAADPSPWMELSRLLGGDRSPRQCKEKWASLQGRGSTKLRRWSTEEDRVLKAAIAAFNAESSVEGGDSVSRKIDWNKLAGELDLSRTAAQCRTRAGYYNTLANMEPWTEEEDDLLRILVSEFETAGRSGGVHWEAVGKRMDDRAALQCRTRWYEHVRLEGRRQRGSFTKEEDTRLANAVMSVRTSEFESRQLFWLKVGEEFGPTRSHTKCRERWRLISAARLVDDDDEDASGDESELEAEED